VDVTVSDNWWPQSGVNHINIPVWCYGAHPQHLSETETSFTISNTSPACPLLLLTIDIVTMCILCRGELCINKNIYLCTHIGIIGKFKWWLIKSTRTKKNIFLCSLRKMQVARQLHQHMQKTKQILNIFGSQMSEISSFWSMKTDNNFKLLMMELEIFYFWPSIQQTCHSSG